jgi:hydroxymethylbilane synthase
VTIGHDSCTARGNLAFKGSRVIRMSPKTRQKAPLRLGTRDSKLALRQAEIVRQALLAADPALDNDGITVVPMKSSGDWRPEQKEQSFAMMGGSKGLFAKELEQALLADQIDLAVHSAKDLETELAEGLILAGFIARDDARDAFICANAQHWEELPLGARVGTASLRRAAQLLQRRPDLVISPLRGNVETRLRKLQEGQVDATLLALCGLQRLELAASDFHPLALEDMLPAVGQGALAIEMRDESGPLFDLVRQVNCVVTEECVSLERLFLHHLNGSCRTPVAAMATKLDDGSLRFRTMVAHPNGAKMQRRDIVLATATAADTVSALGEELRLAFPRELFA